MKLIWMFAVVAVATLNCGTITGAPLTKWFRTDNNTYFIEEQEKYNWQQSYDACQKKNMALITLQAYREDELLLEYIKQSFNPQPEFWLKSSDKVDLGDINQLLGSILAADFLNLKLNGFTEPQIIESDHPDNCVLTADGTVKACDTLHGYICWQQNRQPGGQNIQNIVLKFN